MKRPISVTIIGCLFIVVGVVGLSYHATEFKAGRAFQYDVAWVCLVRSLAIIGGVFLIRGANWARWLLVLWMAYHIVLSMFHSLEQVLMHLLLFGVIGYFLLRRQGDGEVHTETRRS